MNFGLKDDEDEFDFFEQESDEEEVIDSTIHMSLSINESNLGCSTRMNLGECSAQCCADQEVNPFHLNDKTTLQSRRSKNRNFRSQWFSQFPWITVCVSNKKVFVTIVNMLKSINGLQQVGVEKDFHRDRI